MFKTVPQVYRDCLRLIEHIGGRSRKAEQMRALVQRQFRAHAQERDDKKIEELKKNAMTGLANYLTIESLGKLEMSAGTSGGGGGVDRNPTSRLSSVPPTTQPVSERVLALQARIRADKKRRDEEAQRRKE